MKRLLDVKLTLAKQNLAFRGHREKGAKGSDGDNKGNFIGLVKLLSKYDPILQHHLEFPVMLIMMQSLITLQEKL